jgi:prepilin-type N-terminal cleavage/methylation domain-containing protein
MKPDRKCRPFLQDGFSLLEMAVVLMILGTLMGGVLLAIGQTMESNRRTNALAQLRNIESALYGYAQTVSELPCPDINGDGVEDRAGFLCASRRGFVPYSTLGLNGSVNGDGLLIDPWQNPYRYFVENGDDFTVRANLNALFNGPAVTLDQMIEVQCSATASTVCAAGQTIATSVPALVLSMGANWNDCGSIAAAIEEISNGCDGTPVFTYPMPIGDTFFIADYSQEFFDDQMTWISAYVLFSRMVSAGKLP